MRQVQKVIASAWAVAGGGPARQPAEPPEVELARLRRRHAELLREVLDARDEGTMWGRTEFTDKAMEAFNYASRVERQARELEARIVALENLICESGVP